MNQEKRYQSFPLRLSPSIRQQANDLAHSEGISLNHFISLAVAEKIVRMELSVASDQSRMKNTPTLASRLQLKRPA
ncbi:toxin-antitoxin system HicB family antitoxin [Edaphobacter flagellatus]|uniref:toxin-antitoxin system HicB family antitoxin n=1 Tax=Edaphobacter flagellatus TaxID=1933044 RepID=UPI0021B3D18E|nr:toxin-antitoxin system HicB family antitoxin [Edaphobacter flagellatus]